eukprot:4494259-Alexandrium_andersonii.AAC.1
MGIFKRRALGGIRSASGGPLWRGWPPFRAFAEGSLPQLSAISRAPLREAAALPDPPTSASGAHQRHLLGVSG